MLIVATRDSYHKWMTERIDISLSRVYMCLQWKKLAFVKSSMLSRLFPENLTGTNPQVPWYS